MDIVKQVLNYFVGVNKLISYMYILFFLANVKEIVKNIMETFHFQFK